MKKQQHWQKRTLPEYKAPMKNLQSVHSASSKKPYEVEILLQDKLVRMEVDTGATLSLMTHETNLGKECKHHRSSPHQPISAPTQVRV